MPSQGPGCAIKGSTCTCSSTSRGPLPPLPRQLCAFTFLKQPILLWEIKDHCWPALLVQEYSLPYLYAKCHLCLFKNFCSYLLVVVLPSDALSIQSTSQQCPIIHWSFLLGTALFPPPMSVSTSTSTWLMLSTLGVNLPVGAAGTPRCCSTCLHFLQCMSLPMSGLFLFFHPSVDLE